MEPILTLLLVLQLFSLLSLHHLSKRINQIMAVELDLENDLSAISDAIGVLAAEIASLKAQGAPLVTQEQLDALDAKAKAIVAAAQGAV